MRFDWSWYLRTVPRHVGHRTHRARTTASTSRDALAARAGGEYHSAHVACKEQPQTCRVFCLLMMMESAIWSLALAAFGLISGGVRVVFLILHRRGPLRPPVSRRPCTHRMWRRVWPIIIFVNGDSLLDARLHTLCTLTSLTLLTHFFQTKVVSLVGRGICHLRHLLLP